MTEREKLIENHKKHLIEMEQQELSSHSQIINNFLDFCKELHIDIQLSNISYISTIGIVATYPNIANLLNSNVKTDKEELVDFIKLTNEYEIKPFFPGYFFSKNYMLMAHPYFRRGHHANNNFAPRFVEMFWPFSNDKNEKYISLDFDRVRINVDGRKYSEFDTWFGANFTEQIEKIENGIIKLRPPLDLDELDIDFFFHGAYSLDIKWTSYENIKVFQLEEFKTDKYKIKKDGSEYFPVKYVHAEYDMDKKSFRHFDGAIHFYSQEEYYVRRDQDFNYNEKNELQLKTLSQKLFKVNGVVETSDWIELVSHYLSGNPLIIEYFEGKLPKNIQELILKIRENQSTAGNRR